MPDAVGPGDVDPSASSGGAAPLIAIVGPTGTGKSDLALDLAERLGGEIVNTDALQFYRGMDIGTAKLSVAERRGIPHHLLDILDVTEEASVARFQAEVRDVIADIESRGLRPILVGGSGLYVRAALDVLEFPPTDPQVRARWEAHADAVGPDVLRAELREVDPESAERLGDVRRMVRALEVHELTGRPFTSFMPRREYLRPTVQIGLDLDRAELHARLRARVERMVEAGLLDEVARLDAAGLREGKTAARAIGYAQFLKVLDGEWSVEDAVEDTTVATRKFARRQITWFRGDPRVTWLDPTEPDLLSRALRVPGVAVLSAASAVGTVNLQDVEALAALFASNSDYTRRVTGRMPEFEDAAEALTALPSGVEASHKYGVGLWQEGELLGFADVIRGWPDPGIAHIGLLMISGKCHGEGLGRRLHEAVLELVGSWPEISTLRITIVDTNADAAETFWRAQGYTPTGESIPFASGDVASLSRVWVRSL